MRLVQRCALLVGLPEAPTGGYKKEPRQILTGLCCGCYANDYFLVSV